MVWLLSIIGFLVLVLSFLLFIPFYLEIDSREFLCRFRVRWIACATAYFKDETFLLEINVAWWNKQIDLLAIKPQETKPVKHIESKKKKRKIPVLKIIGMVKSFKVNKCKLTIDTGNMPLNGILYPSFFWIGLLSHQDISINFCDENKLVFQAENNIARMVWAFIKS